MTRPALRRGLLLAVLAGAAAFVAPREIALHGLAAGPATVGSARIETSWGAALAQGAETVTLENLALTSGSSTVRVPRLEARGTGLSREALAALFDLGAGDGLAGRLARLTAREIVAPEVRVERSVGGRRQLVVYSNVTIRDAVAGRLGRLEATGAEVRVEGGPSDGGGRYGAIRAADVDLAEIARLYAERAENPGPMRRIYGAFSIEDVALTDEKGIELTIARVDGTGFSARPVRESWAGLTSTFAGLTPDASPEARVRLFRATAELFGAVESGAFEVAGIAVKDPSGRRPVDVRVARVAYGGGVRPAELRFEGLDVGTPDGRVTLASAVSTGFSFAPSLDALSALGDRKPEELNPAELRRLMPTLGNLRLTDLAFEGKAADAEPIRFGLRTAEIRAERPVNGIPTESRIAVDGLTLAVPPETKQEGLRDLAAMGYRDLDLSWLVDVGWSEAAGELAVREVSVGGADMGTARLRGTIDGLTKDAFDPDTAVAAAALMGATARRLDVTIENRGLYERLVAQQAKKQGRTPEELRRDYAMVAAAGIPAVLGGGPNARAIGQAVSRFAARPGRLTIAASAKGPAGLGVADFLAGPSGGAILDLLDVTATAE